MPATVRTRDEIRESLLAKWRTSYAPRRILTTPKSFLWALADALALELEGAEATAAAGTLEAFPQSASEDGVRLHADFAGITPVPAAYAVLRARVSGAGGATVTVTDGATLTSVEGLIFLAQGATLTLDGSGYGYIVVRARDTGSAANLAAGATLTWAAAPAGLASTAVCAAVPGGDPSHVLIAGAEAEDIEALRTRAIIARKEKAQGGNRSEWWTNAIAVMGVGSAYVYPRARRVSGTWSYEVPGGLVLLPLGPAPGEATYVQNANGTLGLGLDPTFTRLPSELLRTMVGDYIEGLRTTTGLPVPDALRRQLRPAGMPPGNYEVGLATTSVQNFVLALTVDPAIARWPWGQTDFPVRNVVSSTTNTITLDDGSGIGDGSRLAVFLGTNVVRGGWWLAQVASRVGNVVTLTTPLASEPAVGADVRPDCGLWSEVRKRVLRRADALGTGDVPAEYIGSQRFPRPSDTGRDRIFVSDITGWLDDIAGLVAVDVTTPSSTRVSAPGELIVPGTIELRIGS